MKDKKEIIETIESSKVLKSINDIKNKKEQKLIYTFGAAGTGKSTLVERIRGLDINTAILAPTGIAALNIGGQTIHSFFQFDFSPSPKIKKKLDSSLIEKLDLLIIDEVSMVNASIMDSIDKALRKTRRNNQPFGGVSMMLVGDLFQLEPVVKESAQSFFYDNYQGTFFFYANVMERIIPEIYVLKHQFRQKIDSNYANLLENIRRSRNLIETLNILNEKCLFRKGEHETKMTLTGSNQSADEKNLERLKRLKTPSKIYEATLTGTFKYKKDKEESLPAPVSLELKKGAQVRMTKNNKSFWANGSIGKVLNLFDDHLEIEIDKNIYKVYRDTWKIINYTWDKKEKKIKEEIKGEFFQFPVRLGWASTIHKAQGLTLDSCTIDLEKAFCHGQSYVALSRCISLEGLNFLQPLTEADIIINPDVNYFYQECVEGLNKKFA